MKIETSIIIWKVCSFYGKFQIEDKPNIRLMNDEAEIIDNVVRVVKE